MILQEYHSRFSIRNYRSNLGLVVNIHEIVGELEINMKALAGNDNLMANGIIKRLLSFGVFSDNLSHNRIRHNVTGMLEGATVDIGNGSNRLVWQNNK